VHFEHHRLTNTDNDPDFKLFTAIFSMSPRAKLLGLLRTLSGIDFILKFVNDFKNASLLRRCLIAVAVMAIIAGLVGSVYPIKLFVLYWLIPFATWGSFVNVVRVVTEHYPPEFYRTVESRENIFLTRDVSLSWFDSIFVMTRGNNYHLTHHLFPSVPFFRLGKLHKEIAASDVYRRSAHVTHGYHRALMEVIFPERYSNPSSLL
jgi:fatty acid desaturase